MFATIEEGLEVYKSVVRDYLAFFDICLSRYGKKREDNPMEYMDRHDWLPMKNYIRKIMNMGKALGLTQEEEKRIQAECGWKDH